jgi:hypothetical protein
MLSFFVFLRHGFMNLLDFLVLARIVIRVPGVLLRIVEIHH